MFTIIVAYNEDFVIGDSKGRIPWQIPEEMRHFKSTTSGNVVIMGRKTWDSIPPFFRPLSSRTNIVISRSNPECVGATVYGSLETAVERLKGRTETLFLIGGQQIYEQALDASLVQKVIASEIKAHSVKDPATFFPDLRFRGWHHEKVKEHESFDVVIFTPGGVC